MNSTSSPAASSAIIALIGHPNVGKSALFHRLTGRYVTISNYPGTTVEVSRGRLRSSEQIVVIDTPGIAALPARGEDERVTEQVLFDPDLRGIVQVGDAKNPRRVLALLTRLAEFGLPMALVCNMADEGAARGVRIDHTRLAELTGIAVVSTVATNGTGVGAVGDALRNLAPPSLAIHYPPLVEAALARLEPLFSDVSVRARAVARLWLGGDLVTRAWAEARLSPLQREQLAVLEGELGELALLADAADAAQAAAVEQLAMQVVQVERAAGQSFGYRLGRLSAHPLWGLPILALILYAFYWFVGVFGAGTLVGWLENDLFGERINPWVTALIQTHSSAPLITDFLVGEYGIWTMGMTYAVALLLPIVMTFFVAFGMLEDSGYLPRLAILSNRAFRRLGLNGQAVLPMVLGLGCVTMATMTTRVLESKRDRVLVTLLLALAVPCSAQLGVVMGMLASISFAATCIWGGVLLGVLFAVGWLAARLLPGERAPLVIELPPIRLPRLSNVLVKTLARLEWYVFEAVPLFLLGTLLLFVLNAAGALPYLVAAGRPVVTGWLGLPAEASAAFLIGFLRRDFGATGLFAMQNSGALTPQQVLVALVTLTLFIPCIASVTMIAKERGWRMASAVVAFVFPFAILVGGLLRIALQLMGWNG